MDEPAKPKRRWQQFSLRTFFVLLTVLCVWFGWQVHRAKQQREAVQWVEKQGGKVWYDYQFDEGGNPISDLQPPIPKWLHDVFGADFFHEVWFVSLDDTQVSDTSPLANLKTLTILGLDNSQVNDLAPLRELVKLELLFLQNTSASEQQAKDLQHALPNCQIFWWQP